MVVQMEKWRQRGEGEGRARGKGNRERERERERERFEQTISNEKAMGFEACVLRNLALAIPDEFRQTPVNLGFPVFSFFMFLRVSNFLRFLQTMRSHAWPSRSSALSFPACLSVCLSLSLFFSVLLSLSLSSFFLSVSLSLSLALSLYFLSCTESESEK